MTAFERPERHDHAQADVVAFSEDRADLAAERADREAEREDARVYRAPVCVCGHAEGSHQSNGSMWGLRFGVCLVAGCDCRDFVDAGSAAA